MKYTLRIDQQTPDVYFATSWTTSCVAPGSRQGKRCGRY